jgi:hypothetical protein
VTHIKITIDDAVAFDGSVTEWTRNPPDMFRSMLKPVAGQPPAAPAAHLLAIMTTFSQAVQRNQSVDIVASTDVDRWSMEVKYR